MLSKLITKVVDVAFGLFLAAVYSLAFYCYVIMYLGASDRTPPVAFGLFFLTAVTGVCFSVTSRAAKDD